MREARTSPPVHRLSGTYRFCAILLAAGASLAVASDPAAPPAPAPAAPTGKVPRISKMDALNQQLRAVLLTNGFTGTVQSSLEARLGRPINQALQNLGRQLFFDPIHALHDDNSCAGCHDPSAGFADSQPIAIGVENKDRVVGVTRKGPRNQRRSPTIINSIFYPAMMWDGRFFAPSGDPFDNSQGFRFPLPEGSTKFLPNDPAVTFLAIAQAHMPSAELKEQAGYTGTRGMLGAQWDDFDDGLGDVVPPPDGSGFRNEPIRAAVQTRMNASRAYRRKFGAIFPSVAAGGPITFTMVAQAIGEWELAMVRANAPLDRFARGAVNAMTVDQKLGALLFFGKANCVACHATAGSANQMFSDFKFHNIGVPQIYPLFGVGKSDVIFDGPGQNEDYGLEQVTHNPADRYKFRTAPLRNLALQPAYFHNGSFGNLALAIYHHLDVVNSARSYDPATNRVPKDLRQMGPMEPVLATLDPLVAQPVRLSEKELKQLVAFVRDALLDPKDNLVANCGRIPSQLPSRMPAMNFVDCPLGMNDGGRFIAAH